MKRKMTYLTYLKIIFTLTLLKDTMSSTNLPLRNLIIECSRGRMDKHKEIHSLMEEVELQGV